MCAHIICFVFIFLIILLIFYVLLAVHYYYDLAMFQVPVPNLEKPSMHAEDDSVTEEDVTPDVSTSPSSVIGARLDCRGARGNYRF